MSEEDKDNPASLQRSWQSLPPWALILVLFLGGGSGGITSSVFRFDKWGATDDAHQDEILRRSIEAGQLEALYIAIDNQPPKPLQRRILAIERRLDKLSPEGYTPPTWYWNDVTRAQVREWWLGMKR